MPPRAHFLVFVRALNLTVRRCDLLTMGELLLRRRRSRRASEVKRGATKTTTTAMIINAPTSHTTGFSQSIVVMCIGRAHFVKRESGLVMAQFENKPPKGILFGTQELRKLKVSFSDLFPSS